MMFGFVKKVFFVGLTILSSFTRANSLSCNLMNDQFIEICGLVLHKSVKQDHELLMLMEMSLCFFYLVLKQVNVVVVVIISTTRMQIFVFLML